MWPYVKPAWDLNTYVTAGPSIARFREHAAGIEPAVALLERAAHETSEHRMPKHTVHSSAHDRIRTCIARRPSF